MDNCIKTKSKRNMKKDKVYLEKDYAYLLLEKDNITKKVYFDKEDIEKISKFKWHLHYRTKDKRYDACSNTYMGTTGKRKYIIMSRYLMNFPQGLTIDHINRNTLDNRKENLRVVSIFENNQNKGNNTSGCVGVTWDKSRNKWYVFISNKYIGRYENLNDAIKARKKANLSFQGKVHQE